jgi:hypothetical protein
MSTRQNMLSYLTKIQCSPADRKAELADSQQEEDADHLARAGQVGDNDAQPGCASQLC